MTSLILLGTHPREMKTYAHTKAYTQIFMGTLFIIAPNWKQPKCSSVDGYFKKFYIIKFHVYHIEMKLQRENRLVIVRVGGREVAIAINGF